ncbi:MAG: type II secretion system F family protein [Verrucomicrobiota bacterium]
MPLGHKQLSSWYLQLAQNLDAGLPLAQALRGTGGPPAASIEAMAHWIEGGGSVEQALLRTKGWLPEAERPLLTAAAMTGRLPQTLRRLSDRHVQLHAIKLRVALSCAYPLFLLHLAVLEFPLLRMMGNGHGLQWSASAYFTTLAALLVPLLGGELWVFLLIRSESPIVDRLASRVPGLRGYFQARSLSDFTFALGHLLDAGVIIAQAWLLAGQTSHSPVLRRAGEAVHDLATAGEAPGLHLHHFSIFSKDYIALYRAGEISGQLDHNLRLLAGQSQEQAVLCLKVAAKIYATLLFLFVAGIVACIVISFYVRAMQLPPF